MCAFATSAGAATLTVMNTDDTGAGSLRQAVEDANADDTIVFVLDANQTITLASDLDPLPEGVTIDATGAPGLTVDGAGFLILGVVAGDADVIDFGTGPGVVQVGELDTLTLTANNDFTLGADIEDGIGVVMPGSLVKDGEATLTLSGTNAFSGDLTIEEGTVIGNSISLPGLITTDAALVFDQPIDDAYDGDIDGTGSLEKRGAGNLTLTGTNTYAGGTTITGGTLSGDTVSLQGDIDVAEDASLVFDQAAAATFAGNVSGAGSLRKTGPEELTLSGSNSYGGGTTITEGRLAGSTASLQGAVTVESIATLVFQQNGSGDFNGSITGAGDVEKLGSGSVRFTSGNDYTGGTTIMEGTLIVDSSSLPAMGGTEVQAGAALVFEQAGNGTFSDVIDGAGTFEKTGGGTLTLTAAHTFTGDATISSGSLDLIGSLVSDVIVGAGGTLGGTGSANGMVEVNGALAPGLGSQGSFNVNDVDFADGSRFVVDLSDDGSGDQLSTGGAEFMAGSAIAVNPAPGDYTAVTIEAIQSATPIVGAIPDPADRVFLTIDADLQMGNPNVLEVTVDGGVDDLEDLGSTRNQKAVGAALDRFTGSPPELSDPGIDELFANMITLDTEAQAQAVLDSLSGEALAAFTTARQAMGERMQRSLHRRMRSVLFDSDDAWPAEPLRPLRQRSRSRGPGPTGAVSGLPAPDDRDVGGWLDGYGIFGDVDGDSNAADVEYDVYGGTLGADFRLGENVLVGFAGGYARTDVDVDDRDSDGDADTAQGALYAAYASSWLYAGVSGRYAWSNADSSRRIAVGSFGAKARGDFDSNDYGLRGELAVDAFEAGGMRVQPLVAFDWAHLDRESFDERGAGSLGLEVDSEDLDSALLQLGGRFDAVFPLSEYAVLAPELHAYWLHEFGDRDRDVQAAIAGAPFEVEGADVPRDSGLVGVGWAMSLGRSMRATAEYDLRIDSDRLEQIGNVTLRLLF